ncbi:MAG: hypothetical protein L3K01_09005 [Thermoplasmata archaeon]|nr:hypothetical protein [Thermoplasmata archaeon]
MIRRNAGVAIGGTVRLGKITPPPADSISIAPIRSGSAKRDLGPGLEQFVGKALLGRPFVSGDVFLIPGAFLEGSILVFRVELVKPETIVQIAPSTLITILDGMVMD